MASIGALNAQTNAKGIDLWFPPTIDANTIGHEIATVFGRLGYRLEQGTASNGTFGMGSAVARAFLGALVQRAKFYVMTQPAQEYTYVQITKGMSGWWGGIIGASQMSKQVQVIQQVFYQEFVTMAPQAADTAHQLPPQQPPSHQLPPQQ